MSDFRIKDILDIIFKATRKNANILADSYLIKDPSIISKWKNNSTVPKQEDLLKIVSFTVSESTSTQHRIIREKIDHMISGCSISEDIKCQLMEISDFDRYLYEVLNVSTSLNHVHTNDLLKQFEDIGANSTNKTYISEKKEYDKKTISSFSKSDKTVYSGKLELDLLLSQDSNGKLESVISQSQISFANNPHGKIKKTKLISKSVRNVLGTVIIGTISSFLVMMASSQMITDTYANDFNKNNAHANSIKVSSQMNNTVEVKEKLQKSDFQNMQDKEKNDVQRNTDMAEKTGNEESIKQSVSSSKTELRENREESSKVNEVAKGITGGEVSSYDKEVQKSQSSEVGTEYIDTKEGKNTSAYENKGSSKESIKRGQALEQNIEDKTTKNTDTSPNGTTPKADDKDTKEDIKVENHEENTNISNAENVVNIDINGDKGVVIYQSEGVNISIE